MSGIRFFGLAAITESGDLYTWGENRAGQLGHGDTDDRHSPTRVQGLPSVIAVDSSSHVVVITASGDLYSWGENFWGQLGYPEHDTDSPSYIEAYDYNRTAARNRFDGRQIDFYTTGRRTGVPKFVPGISDVIAISAAYGHTAAITANGDLYTWGYNSSGQLGYVSYTVISIRGTGPILYMEFTGVPTMVPGLANVVSVSLGRSNSSAVTADGGLYTWGNARAGLLGDGTTDNRNNPVRITRVR